MIKVDASALTLIERDAIERLLAQIYPEAAPDSLEELPARPTVEQYFTEQLQTQVNNITASYVKSKLPELEPVAFDFLSVPPEARNKLLADLRAAREQAAQ